MNLAAQFRKVLGATIGQEGDNVCAVFDYAAEFRSFWDEGQFSGEELPAPAVISRTSESSEKALIIAWDGMPANGQTSDKLLAPHLTPLDWALAFSMRMLALNKTNRAPFSVHIIDLTVKAYEDSYALRMRAVSASPANLSNFSETKSEEFAICS